MPAVLHPSRRRGAAEAFTLVELLVSMVIVGILAGLAYAAFRSAAQKSKLVREVSAARLLTAAFLAAAADRDGTLLPGYDRTVEAVDLPGGSQTHGPAAQRYPYRLAPYLNHQIKGTILINDYGHVDANSAYEVSLYPAFGINHLFVGGDVQSDGTYTYPAECIARQTDIVGSVLVFATAGTSANATGTSAGKQLNGFCTLTPPRLTSSMWSAAAWTSTSRPESYGHVHPRHGGKAVCAFLDGSVRQLSLTELRDMRLWNKNAVAADRADYTIAPAGSGPVRP